MSEQTPPAAPPPPQDRIVTSQHRLELGDRSLGYTVTAGTIVLAEEHEKEGSSEGVKPRAEIFFVAYTLDGVEDLAARPVTFAFNGGPGSSSVWLHMGVLGPRRVALDDEGRAGPPPYRLIDNPHSLLAASDLVFIDPVSTGFSRVVAGEKAKEFHGFKRDIASVGDFIRLYTTRYRRWASPKYLAGESYGTTRAGGLAGYLQERHGMYLNGLMLISAALNFQTLDFHPANDLPYLVHLPTYTAAAWGHRRLPDDLQADLRGALAEAEQFALGEYATALLRGSALEDGERARIAQRLARLTGLSADYVLRSDLRIEIMRFTKELLRAQGRTIGRLDTRYSGIDRDAAGEHFEYDPSYAAIQGPYTAALNHYVRAELGFESDLPYEILTERVWPWSYAEFENRYVEVGETLRKAMSVNPHLRVYVASGYFDLATPYFATEYVLRHLGLDPELRGNLMVSYYEAGHMMYVHRPSLERMGAELAAFVGGGA